MSFMSRVLYKGPVLEESYDLELSICNMLFT